MRKVFCFVLIVLLITMVFYAEYGNTGGNNKKCIDAAQRIGGFDGVDAVAVLKLQDRILAGIRVAQINPETSNKIRSVLKGLFPNVNDLKIEVSNNKAEEIIELSYFVDSDMPKNIIEGRFEFLWNN